jgi:hypothetical protein
MVVSIDLERIGLIFKKPGVCQNLQNTSVHINLQEPQIISYLD